jgi:hypothetical protein
MGRPVTLLELMRPRWILAWVGLVGTLVAAPEKRGVDQYSRLWLDSPFTRPAEPVVQAPRPGQLDDFVLMGVSQLPDGYFVVLVNKKQRDERIVIVPGDVTSRRYRVDRVVQDPDDVMATQVTISVDGRETAVLEYDRRPLGRKAVEKRATRVAIPKGIPRRSPRALVAPSS